MKKRIIYHGSMQIVSEPEIAVWVFLILMILWRGRWRMIQSLIMCRDL